MYLVNVFILCIYIFLVNLSLLFKRYIQTNILYIQQIIFVREKMSPTLPSIQTLSTLYVFRVLHIGSLIGLGYKIINDYLTGSISTQHSTLFAIVGVTAMVSGIKQLMLGFVNTFLLQPKKMGERRKLWISWNHIKLLITLVLFSPIYKLIPPLSDNLIYARFYWLVVVALLSPAARFYR